MIELLDSVFTVIQSILSAAVIQETINDVDYSITLGQIVIVCILVGVAIRLFLPRAGGE